MSAETNTQAPLTTEELAILSEVTGLNSMPHHGAFNVRVNGGSVGRHSSDNISITAKEDGTGIDITVAADTVGETVYIPVVVSASGLHDVVQNDFYLGKNSSVVIIAGCGIHNEGHNRSQHDGIHRFHVAEGASLRYEENHIGLGEGNGERVLNPITEVFLGKNSHVLMETTQIKGVDSTKRVTNAQIEEGATLVVKEKLMTHGRQEAVSEFNINLDGSGSGTNIVSRSVAKGESSQVFLSRINGNAACTGHSECDAIIMDSGRVKAIPEVSANHVDASLIHEAAIGKIAGEQIIKLMTLGLTEEEAEATIVDGFLK